MTLRDLVRKSLVAASLAPLARLNGTALGLGVDLRGYDAAVVAVTFGTWTDGVHTPSLQHSMDGVTYTAVPAAELDGTFAAVSSAAGNNTVQCVGYIGTQRFLRAVMVTTGATSGALSSASIVAGYPRNC